MITKTEFEVLELDGSDISTLRRPKISVSSHWAEPGWVVLKFEDETAVTVSIRYLEKAVRNAKND